MGYGPYLSNVNVGQCPSPSHNLVLAWKNATNSMNIIGALLPTEVLGSFSPKWEVGLVMETHMTIRKAWENSMCTYTPLKLMLCFS